MANLQPAPQKIRWGILSTAVIGTAKVIPAMQRGDFSEVSGIASRDPEKAAKVAGELGIPKCYGSYEELLADPEIDAVYNPLPNHLHVPLSIQALEAGKHVLCEKPIGLTSDEGRQLAATAKIHPHLKVMEAFMYRHHPQWVRAKEIVAEGTLGDLRTIQSFFSYFNDNPDNIRSKPEWGGGGLMDIGCYCISLSRFLFDAEPGRVVGLVEYDPDLGVDRLASGILDFGNRSSTFTCSTQLKGLQRVDLMGTDGRLEIVIPFNAPPDGTTRLNLYRDGEFAEAEPIEIPPCDQYTIQGDLMSRAILDDTPVPTPLADAIANMEVIEALVASGKESRWVNLG